MLVVSVGDQTDGLVPQGEFGFAEEGLIGGSHQAAGHLQNRRLGPAPDPSGEFLGFLFQFGFERFGHDGLLP